MSYPSDLHDEEWEKIAIYFQPKSKRGKPRKHDQKMIVNAILYILKGGIT
jgi:transposase